MIFLDWLDIYEDHLPGSLPVFGSDWVLSTPIEMDAAGEGVEVVGAAFVSFVDRETGESIQSPVTWKSVRSYHHEGSYDTSLCIRCDGTRVRVSGNPSAFCRKDNLFGFMEVSDAVDFYNQVLQLLGLPPFVDLTSDLKSAALEWNDRGQCVGNGKAFAHSDASLSRYGRPTITGIHLTENIETGRRWVGAKDLGYWRENSEDFLLQLSGYSHQGRSGYLYPNRATVDWRGGEGGSGCVGSRRIYHKYYRPSKKFGDKIDKLQKLLKKDVENIGLQEHIRHLQKIVEHCDSVGLVRHEIELKLTELIDRKLQNI